MKTIVYLLLFLLLLVYIDKTYAGDSTNTIIINEVLFDPINEDSGREWIELYNKSTNEITISNWKIFIAGTVFKETAAITVRIPPQSYSLICEEDVPGCNLYVPKLAFQNGGGATDAIELISDQGIIVDQVFYDRPNLNQLKDSENIIVLDNQSALIGKSGESLGRKNFIDTNNSAQDFYILPTPTPGAINNLSIDTPLQTGENPSFLITIFLIFIFSGMLIYINNLVHILYGKSSKKREETRS